MFNELVNDVVSLIESRESRDSSRAEKEHSSFQYSVAYKFLIRPPSAAHSKNIIREHPHCPMRWRGHFNCKTNCETDRVY